MTGIGKFILPYSPGGGANPDPAVYCPANGYTLANHDYIPPEGIILPNSTPESIIFICDSSFGNWTSPTFTKGGTTSNYRYQFFDLSGNLIYSVDSSTSNINYVFPAIGYYIVKITLVNAGGVFLSMASTYTTYSFIIEKVIFNTPNLTSLANCCKYMTGLRDVEFNCTLNSLTSFANSFQYSGLYNFTFKDSYPALTTVINMFTSTDYLEKVEFPLNCNLPVLSSMQSFINLSNVNTLLLPESAPALTIITYLCQDSKNLSTIRFIQNAPALTSASYAFSGTKLNGEQILPLYNPTSTGTFMYHNINELTKVTLTVPENNVSCNFQNILYLDRKIINVTFPSRFGCTVAGPNVASNVLKTAKLPDILLSGSITNPQSFISDSLILESVTGDMDNTGLTEATPSFYLSKNSLKTFNCPKLRCSAIRFGYSNTDVLTVLETLEVDWLNSSWTTAIGGLTYNIQITANVSAAWLNDLMNKLPVVTGSKTLYIKYCTGFAACDKTIATNKGWTVIL